MSSIEVGFMAISILISLVTVGAGLLAGIWYRDQIFADLTPGLTPARGAQARVERVQPGREYSGEIAVAFAPPRGLRPGLIGTVVDGQAEMRDITATIVDLAVRGWLRIEAIGAAEPTLGKGAGKKPGDWRLTQLAAPAGERLEPFEKEVLASVFSTTPDADGGVLMSRWTESRSKDLMRLRDRLYEQTLAHGWYMKDPRPTRGGCLPILGWVAVGGYLALMLLAVFSIWTLVAAVLVAGSAWFASKRLRRRVPRTALGTAVTISALGFKKYLATAEADQFSFEEAAGVFSRYLPYALVFGVAEHWAKVFGEVAARSREVAGLDLLDALAWFDLSGLDLVALNGLDLMISGDLFDVGDALGAVFDAADGLGGFAESVGDFISGIDIDF